MTGSFLRFESLPSPKVKKNPPHLISWNGYIIQASCESSKLCIDVCTLDSPQPSGIKNDELAKKWKLSSKQKLNIPLGLLLLCKIST